MKLQVIFRRLLFLFNRYLMKILFFIIAIIILKNCISPYYYSFEYERFVEKIVKPIMIPREPKSVGIKKVQSFIHDYLVDLGWTTTINSFNDNTPLGLTNFNNIISTHNPLSSKRIIFACHYDTKIFPDNGDKFVGATDSAVPCAILLELAKYYEFIPNNKDVSLQLIFFDGEEAFENWSEKDSLYGSRNLAEVMSKSFLKGHHPSKSSERSKFYHQNSLDTIEVFVLLDLIGATNIQFQNFYFYNSMQTNYYKNFVQIEKKLKSTNKLLPYDGVYFNEKPFNYFIEDDHAPFLKKGINIVHLIDYPFEKFWHTPSDNADVLSESDIKNLVLIFQQFIKEMLEIQNSN